MDRLIDFMQHVYDTQKDPAGLGFLVFVLFVVSAGLVGWLAMVVSEGLQSCVKHWRDVRVTALEVAKALGRSDHPHVGPKL